MGCSHDIYYTLNRPTVNTLIKVEAADIVMDRADDTWAKVSYVSAENAN